MALCFTVSALDCRPLIPELVCAWREAGSRFTPVRLDKPLPQRRLLTVRVQLAGGPRLCSVVPMLCVWPRTHLLVAFVGC